MENTQNNKDNSKKRKHAKIGFLVGVISMLHFGMFILLCLGSCSVLFQVSSYLNPAFYVFMLLNFFTSDGIAYTSFLFSPLTFALVGYFFGDSIEKLLIKIKNSL